MTNENDDPVVVQVPFRVGFRAGPKQKRQSLYKLANKGMYTSANNIPMDQNIDLLVKQVVTLMRFNN